jgi:hypothetical protein
MVTYRLNNPDSGSIVESVKFPVSASVAHGLIPSSNPPLTIVSSKRPGQEVIDGTWKFSEQASYDILSKFIVGGSMPSGADVLRVQVTAIAKGWVGSGSRTLSTSVYGCQTEFTSNVWPVSPVIRTVHETCPSTRTNTVAIWIAEAGRETNVTKSKKYAPLSMRSSMVGNIT